MAIDDGSISELREVVLEAERRQMRANGRIRRELAGLAVMVLAGLVAIIAMWSGVQWRWWYGAALPVVALIWMVTEGSRAQEAEDPK